MSIAPKSLTIRAQRRDKHNLNQTHNSKTICICGVGQPDHRELKSEKPDQKIRFQFPAETNLCFQRANFYGMFISKSRCSNIKGPAALPFAMAEACFEYILVVHWSEPGRLRNIIEI